MILSCAYMKTAGLFLLLTILCCAKDVIGFQKLSPDQHYARFKERAASRRLEENIGRVFYPIKYGADPKGGSDSSDAIRKAIEDAFKVQHNKHMLQGVNDLGGVIIDLQGGDYKITNPISFPANGGANVVIQGGSLRASDNFPNQCSLVQLWSPATPREGHENSPCKSHENVTKNNSLDVYYEDITFRDILFDSTNRGGGILAINAVRIRIDNCYFKGFTTVGILVESGHEVFISSSFLGQIETIGGDKREKDFSGTAISLAGNDHAVTDVTIFSAAVGILLLGQANILTGVHCYNKATTFGGVGILGKTPCAQTRIDNCYMDYNSIVLEDPKEMLITNTFFLGDGNVKLKAVEGEVHGLTIVNNIFSGNDAGVSIVKLDQSHTKFQKVGQVTIDNNVVSKMVLKATKARKSVAGKGKKWRVDFESLLVFHDLVTHVDYSLYVKNKNKNKNKNNVTVTVPAHAITSIKNNTVVVEATEEVDGVVSVAVDQYLAPGETNHLH